MLPTQIPKEGELIDGIVLGKEGAYLYVDLGAFGTGVIYGKEYYDAQDLIKGVKVGDKVSAKVVELQNEDGYVELSLKEAGQQMIWEDLEKLRQSGEVISVKITEVNRGGLMAAVKGIPAFMPVSQLSVKNYPRVDGGDKSRILQELNKFVNKNMDVKVIDVNQRDEKLIVSEKEVGDKAIKEFMGNFKVGDIIDGEVSGVVDFGAFIKIGTPSQGEKSETAPHVEGLVHISELDWRLIEDPKQVVKIGDKVQAKIIGIEGDKISLSIKALKKDPWEDIEDLYKTGQSVKGKVVKLNPFGAFVKLDDSIQGLCHISEFKSEDEMKEKMEVGKSYQFNVQLINKAEHRMALGFGKATKKEKSEEAVPAGRQGKEKSEENKEEKGE